VGYSGNKIGTSFWSSVCTEYGIKFDGKRQENGPLIDPNSFFEEKSKGVFAPRALFFDSDGSRLKKIDESSELKDLFEPRHFVTSPKGKAKNVFIYFVINQN
jgi:tubulin beta